MEPNGINLLLEEERSRLYELLDALLEHMPTIIEEENNEEGEELGNYEYRLEGAFLPIKTTHDTTGEFKEECLDEKLE